MSLGLSLIEMNICSLAIKFLDNQTINPFQSKRKGVCMCVLFEIFRLVDF